MTNENPLVVKFRQQLLGRGSAGIKNLSIFFRQIDDNGSRTLSEGEFQQGIVDHNISLSEEEISALFKLFDRDGTGTISVNEFIQSVRPPLNDLRSNLIKQAFHKMDKTNDNRITIDDLKGAYCARKNPKFLSGEMTEAQVFEHFLNGFETGKQRDGIITAQEFFEYYCAVSANIDDDDYFEAMMRKCWNL